VCTLVDARLRSGDVVTGKFSDNLKFVHTGGMLDVMAYRVNESVDTASTEVTTPVDGPLQWRDRVTEIDRTVESLEEERASLIQKLADEGFKLKACTTIGDALGALEKAGLGEAVQYVRSRMSESLDSFVTRLSADEFGALIKREAVELLDMSDWRNWRQGDILVRLTDTHPSVYTKGKKYKILGFYGELPKVNDNFGKGSSCIIEPHEMHMFKWYSRPTK